MAKKSILVWLTLLMVLFSSISIYADENVQGDFFVKHVVINGEEIANYNLQYPFIQYRNTLYIPLTPGIGEICGFSATVDWDSHTLKLLKTDSTKKNISSNALMNDNKPIEAQVVMGATVEVFDSSTYVEAGEHFDVPATAEETLRLEDGTPVLRAGGFAYLPLRAFTNSKIFRWDIYFDPYYGVCVSTNSEVPAKDYWDGAESARNQGLVGYIQRYNPSITTSIGQNLVFFFQRAADVYDTDELLLMAIARRESTFNAFSGMGSATRPAGMMQILPSTAAAYGLTVNDLYDPYTNISFGAMYISERIKAYGGDWTVGLSAYNQGSAKVNRGSYSTAYATRVLSAYSGLKQYLADNTPVVYETASASMQLQHIGVDSTPGDQAE